MGSDRMLMRQTNRDEYVQGYRAGYTACNVDHDTDRSMNLIASLFCIGFGFMSGVAFGWFFF